MDTLLGGEENDTANEEKDTQNSNDTSWHELSAVNSSVAHHSTKNHTQSCKRQSIPPS